MCVAIDHEEIQRIDIKTKEVSVLFTGGSCWGESVFKSPSYPHDILVYSQDEGLFFVDIATNESILHLLLGG